MRPLRKLGTIRQPLADIAGLAALFLLLGLALHLPG